MRKFTGLTLEGANGEQATAVLPSLGWGMLDKAMHDCGIDRNCAGHDGLGSHLILMTKCLVKNL